MATSNDDKPMAPNDSSKHTTAPITVKSTALLSSSKLMMNKNRRSFSRKYKLGGGSKTNNLVCIGTNSNGLNTKRESLCNLVNTLNPSIVTIQETKFMLYRTLKLNGFEIFENLRDDRMGGGLLTAVRVDLQPLLVDLSNIYLTHAAGYIKFYYYNHFS